MALQLTALQQHCLAGIGISTWHQRHNTSSQSINEPAVAQPIDGLNDPAVDNIAREKIDKALEYIAGFDNSNVTLSIDNKLENITLVNNVLTIPNLSDVLSSSTLKKQLWTLMAGIHS